MKFALCFAFLFVFTASGCRQNVLQTVAAAAPTPVTPLVVSPLSYGALCNGTSDDSVGINAAIGYLRAQANSTTPLTGIVQLPAAQCILQHSINATGLIFGSGPLTTSGSVTISGTGGSLLCETNGTPCIDATNSQGLSMRDINIFTNNTNIPNIGLQTARPAMNATSAQMYLDHITMIGYFSLAAYYNLNAETQLITKLNVQNLEPGGYGAVYDGYNHFNAQSAFSAITEPVEAAESFGDNTCISCRITSNAPGAVPLWAGGTIGLTFVNSYISNFGTGYGAVLYNSNTNLHFDAHFEASGLTSIFLLTGNVHPVIYGMIYREHDFFGNVSMFALDSGTKAATLENVDLSIGRIQTTNGQWFDNPAAYTVSGRVAGFYTQGWVTPGGGFSGTTCFQTKCTTY